MAERYKPPRLYRASIEWTDVIADVGTGSAIKRLRVLVHQPRAGHVYLAFSHEREAADWEELGVRPDWLPVHVVEWLLKRLPEAHAAMLAAMPDPENVCPAGGDHVLSADGTHCDECGAARPKPEIDP